MSLARELSRFVLSLDAAALPAAVRTEAARSMLNWAGCAVGGCRHPAIDAAVAALLPFAAGTQCSLMGRRERTDALHAALINGMSAHVLDFDDTHLRTLMHPSVPVASSLMALAECMPITGERFLVAFVAGVEVECRIANAVWFAHNADWYITGTAGVFGAAAACAQVLDLAESQTTHALGLAAAQSAGTREMAGTMAKCFIHGRAAQNGLLAALLAQRGLTAAATAIEGVHGFAQVLAPRRDLDAVTAGLGTDWELLQNSYKPYACGVVAHPVIDACLRLRRAHRPDPAAIVRLDLRVSPRALELTGIVAPPDGLKSKWSLFHSAAVALVDGAAGEHQYTDERVNDPVVREVRSRVGAVADPSLSEIEARAVLSMSDGNVHEVHVEAVVGSAANPMSDADLADKVRGLALGLLPDRQVEALIGTCRGFAALPDASAIARAGALG
ncbi:MAG: MmgE/PrpD family protein [bacterium]|jgi:2-methylcitrate dehydratase PrpD|nr:MmgE/PrpD family protein [Betaproteobacteria bacterium]